MQGSANPPYPNPPQPLPQAYFKPRSSSSDSPNSPSSSNPTPTKPTRASKIILPSRTYDEMMTTRKRLLEGVEVPRPELRRFLKVLRKKDPKLGMSDIQQFIRDGRIAREEESKKACLIANSSSAGEMELITIESPAQQMRRIGEEVKRKAEEKISNQSEPAPTGKAPKSKSKTGKTKEGPSPQSDAKKSSPMNSKSPRKSSS